MAFALISGARHSLSPPLRARPLTTPQASRHATDRIVAPPCRAFDAGLRRRAFPPGAASLLPGLLAATRTGLPPAGDDELTNSKIRCYVTASPPALLGARKMQVSIHHPLRESLDHLSLSRSERKDANVPSSRSAGPSTMSFTDTLFSSIVIIWAFQRITEWLPLCTRPRVPRVANRVRTKHQPPTPLPYTVGAHLGHQTKVLTDLAVGGTF